MRTGCDAVRLRRGGYYPPGCFPYGKTTSAQSADNGTIKHLMMKFGGIVSEHGTFGTIKHLMMKFGGIVSEHGTFGIIGTLPGQCVFAQKFATLAGG